MKTTPIDGYRSERVSLEYLSDLEPNEAEALVGKVVSGIEGTEYGLVLTFADGSKLDIGGHTYADCALRVEAQIVNPPDED